MELNQIQSILTLNLFSVFLLLHYSNIQYALLMDILNHIMFSTNMLKFKIYLLENYAELDYLVNEVVVRLLNFHWSFPSPALL